MKPTRDQIEIIILEMMKQEIIITEFEKIIHMMSPDTYKPIITAFNSLKPLEVLYPDIYNCVSYWWYDCDCFDDKIWTVINDTWKELKIQARSLESLKKYLLREWVITT